MSSRSSIGPALQAQRDIIAKAAKLCGARVAQDNAYPGMPPALRSIARVSVYAQRWPPHMNEMVRLCCMVIHPLFAARIELASRQVDSLSRALDSHMWQSCGVSCCCRLGAEPGVQGGAAHQGGHAGHHRQRTKGTVLTTPQFHINVNFSPEASTPPSHASSSAADMSPSAMYISSLSPCQYAWPVSGLQLLRSGRRNTRWPRVRALGGQDSRPRHGLLWTNYQV